MKKLLLTLIFITMPCLSFAKVEFNGLAYEFSLELPGAQEVILLFSFDNYKTQYYMSRDDYNAALYKLELDMPKIGNSIKPGKYYYRVIADGILTYDSTSPLDIIPSVGKMSYFVIENQYLDNLSGPVQIDPFKYRFFYHRSGKQTMPTEILLTGDFNSWNLYGYILKQSTENPDVWYVDIAFDQPGKKEYMFIVDGKWVADINNPLMVRNGVGQDVSVLQVK